MISARQANENAKAYQLKREEEIKEKSRLTLQDIGVEIEKLSTQGKFQYLTKCDADSDVFVLVVRKLKDLGYTVKNTDDGVLEIKW